MSRKKLIRFDEMKLFSNTFEQPIGMKGKWHSEVFKNTNPMVLELGCGRGEYTIGLSSLFPDKNFIGIDFLEYFPGLVRVLLAARRGLEFIKTHGTIGIGIEFLEDFLRIGRAVSFLLRGSFLSV